jgi:isopenicillin-N N-acyltransferase-like protein
MITEAGLIGKIGLNSAGVGVCFNAIRAKGLNKSYILVHLGLRITLESRLALQAVKSLKSIGIASSAHRLISNANNAVRLEFMALIFSHIPVDMMGFIAHLNHMLLPHAGINEPAWLADSLVRVATVGENIKSLGGKLDQERFGELFRDKTGFPCLINRATSEGSDIATLFNIVMDLGGGGRLLLWEGRRMRRRRGLFLSWTGRTID